MPTHYWGEEGYDWEGINNAAEYVGEGLRKWGRVNVTQYKEKFGCYSTDTEVLTKAGWRLFKDIAINNDEFAVLNEGYLEYEKATESFTYDYSGLLYSLETRGVDLLVTLDHNLYAAKADVHGGINDSGYKRFPLELQTFGELYRKPKRFVKGAEWVGKSATSFVLPEYSNEWIAHHTWKRKHKDEAKEFKMVPWLAFLGWFVAEGNADPNKGQISLALNGTDAGAEEKLVSSIIEELGIKYSTDHRDWTTVLRIHSVQLAKWLYENCGGEGISTNSLNICVPGFIKELSPQLIKTFLEALYMGDGHKAETSHILTTISKHLADDVLELLLKAGYCGRTYSREPRLNDSNAYINGRKINSKHQTYEVNWLTKTEHQTINSHDSTDVISKKEKLIEYVGKVYCVSVPSKIIYVRRNGKPVWCGNSVRCYCWLGLSWWPQITHPGYIANPWPKWTWTFQSKPQWLFKLLNKVIVPYHKWLYRKLYSNAVKKWPHLKDEILCCADYPELLKGKGMIEEEEDE